MASATSPVRVQLHHRIDAVDEASWDALCARMERPTFFNSHAWTTAWAEHFGEDRQPLLLAAERDGELVGLLPLAITPQQRLVFKRTLLAPLTALSMGAAQYLGPICAREHEPEVLDALARAVGELQGIDAVYLENFLAGSITQRLVERMECQGQGRFMRWSGETTHRRPLPPTYEAFFKTLTKKKRQNIRTARNKLARGTAVTFRRVEGDEELSAAIASFRQHSVTRLGEKGIRSTLTDQRMEGFFSEIIHRAAASGHGVTFAAYDGEALIGTLFALHFGRWICYYNGSFDVAYSRLSIGRLLVDELVRFAIEHHFEELDLLAGSGGYKQRWVPGADERLHFASLPVTPISTLPHTLWDAWKAAHPSHGAPEVELDEAGPGPHPLLWAMQTARGQLERAARLHEAVAVALQYEAAEDLPPLQRALHTARGQLQRLAELSRRR